MVGGKKTAISIFFFSYQCNILCFGRNIKKLQSEPKPEEESPEKPQDKTEHLLKDGYGVKVQEKNDSFTLSLTNNSSIYSPKVSGLKPKYFHTILHNKSKISADNSLSAF